MNKKQWLLRAKYIDNVIEALESEMFFERSKELEALIAAKKQKLYETKEEIYKEIDKIRDNRYFLILFERYIAMKTWEEIAEDNHFSRSHVLRLHGEALKRLNIEKQY